MARTTLHVATPHLRVQPLVAIHRKLFQTGYEKGVTWSLFKRETTGLLADRYLPDRLTTEIVYCPVLFSAPYEQNLCWQAGFWLGMIHGGVLLPDGSLHPDATTLVSLHDQWVTRGYYAGRHYFFVETETDEQRAVTDTHVLDEFRELAAEYGTYEDNQATLRFAMGGVLGKLSGHLFPWTAQEQAHTEQESLCLLGYVEPLLPGCQAALQPA